MLSNTTCIELIAVIETYVEKITDRIFTSFDLEHRIHLSEGRFNHEKKLNILLKELLWRREPTILGGSIRMDLLQYMLNHFYRHEDDPNKSNFLPRDRMDHIPYEDRFTYSYPALASSLKRDGYVLKGRTIKKMLPEEIEEAKIETELEGLLNKFNFTTARGHLQQAIANHSQANWASANSQFRPFIESLLIDICSVLLPNNPCNNANTAITILSKTANPPFLLEALNEVESNNCKKPFIEGLWKRLHPAGNHPGLSDEEDCTFRYHITIVTAHNLLKRLEKRLGS